MSYYKKPAPLFQSIMAMGVLEAKNNFSAIISAIASGEKDHETITRYGKPVAIIVPYDDSPEVRLGMFEDRKAVSNWDAFDALDDEIADEFGA